MAFIVVSLQCCQYVRLCSKGGRVINYDLEEFLRELIEALSLNVSGITEEDSEK